MEKEISHLSWSPRTAVNGCAGHVLCSLGGIIPTVAYVSRDS